MFTRKILIVEDYDDYRRALRLYIEQQGFEVVEAQNGFEAIELAQIECPRLILMDLALPKVDGIDAALAISSDICPEVPIVLITAFDYRFEQAGDLRKFEVLRKPIAWEQIGQVLKKYAGV